MSVFKEMGAQVHLGCKKGYKNARIRQQIYYLHFIFGEVLEKYHSLWLCQESCRYCQQNAQTKMDVWIRKTK